MDKIVKNKIIKIKPAKSGKLSKNEPAKNGKKLKNFKIILHKLTYYDNISLNLVKKEGNN